MEIAAYDEYVKSRLDEFKIKDTNKEEIEG
jgi:hypothetical protein